MNFIILCYSQTWPCRGRRTVSSSTIMFVRNVEIFEKHTFMGTSQTSDILGSCSVLGSLKAHVFWTAHLTPDYLLPCLILCQMGWTHLENIIIHLFSFSSELYLHINKYICWSAQITLKTLLSRGDREGNWRHEEGHIACEIQSEDGKISTLPRGTLSDNEAESFLCS